MVDLKLAASVLTLIWVGFLGIRFAVGVSGVKSHSLSKTLYDYAIYLTFGTK